MGVKLGNGKWAIKEDKLLAYNDNSGRFFNKEFDFSRGSSATYVAKDGLIKTAGLQATNLVNNGDFSQIGSELVTNGDFNDGLNGWSSHSSSILELEDGRAKVTTVGGQGFIKRTDLSIQSGKIYFCTAQITNATIPQFFINGTSNSLNPMPLISGDTYGGYITTTGANSTFYIRGNNVDGQVSFIDNVSVKQVDPNDYWTLGTGWGFGDGKVLGVNATGNLQQSVNFTNGSLYKISFDVSNYVSGQVRLQTNQQSSIVVSANGTYVQYLTMTTDSLLILNGIDSNPFNGSISNISVQEIQTDTPRIDFSDSVKGALLLEPQSTNLITHSEDFSSLQIRSNAVVTSNVIVSPSGVLDADEITFDGTYSGRVEQTISAIVGESYTISLYLKNKDLSDKTQVWIGFSAAVQGQFFTITDEWQRYDITTTADGTSEYPRIQFSGTGSLYAWGFQVEQLSYATSYIPTYGSTATRIADVCNNSGSAQDFNSEEGVLYFEAKADNTDVGSISINNGTLSVRITARFRTDISKTQMTISGSTDDFNYNSETITLSEYNKVAIVYNNSQYYFFINGVKSTIQNKGTFSANSFTQFDFNRGGGSEIFYGKVREVQVFTEALTDEQLQKLTTI